MSASPVIPDKCGGTAHRSGSRISFALQARLSSSLTVRCAHADALDSGSACSDTALVRNDGGCASRLSSRAKRSADPGSSIPGQMHIASSPVFFWGTTRVSCENVCGVTRDDSRVTSNVVLGAAPIFAWPRARAVSIVQLFPSLPSGSDRSSSAAILPDILDGGTG